MSKPSAAALRAAEQIWRWNSGGILPKTLAETRQATAAIIDREFAPLVAACETGLHWLVVLQSDLENEGGEEGIQARSLDVPIHELSAALAEYQPGSEAQE